ncbi:hypothetical protein Pelo_99 [Pelomyxa schiedti]|nr:hypothetical protein Pelo_99 [Pelomyxa schiedti]
MASTTSVTVASACTPSASSGTATADCGTMSEVIAMPIKMLTQGVDFVTSACDGATPQYYAVRLRALGARLRALLPLLSLLRPANEDAPEMNTLLAITERVHDLQWLLTRIKSQKIIDHLLFFLEDSDNLFDFFACTQSACEMLRAQPYINPTSIPQFVPDELKSLSVADVKELLVLLHKANELREAATPTIPPAPMMKEARQLLDELTALEASKNEQQRKRIADLHSIAERFSSSSDTSAVSGELTTLLNATTTTTKPAAANNSAAKPGAKPKTQAARDRAKRNKQKRKTKKAASASTSVATTTPTTTATASASTPTHNEAEVAEGEAESDEDGGDVATVSCEILHHE